MFKINDLVHYGTSGVCVVSEIVERVFKDEPVTYYVLKPMFSKNATLYVPTSNSDLTSRMRKLITKKQINELLSSLTDDDCIWIDNENERKNRFKEILLSGNSRDMVCLIRTLYLHQEEKKATGKKMHLTDERFFKDAERLVYDEFSVALKIPQDEVIPYIKKFIEGN
ncbi:MAG: CarD family transcriptional regulator [Lachnospiraceae bacterium]|nr:CarD family transcriptional regulator [Candidatus Minthocola equi]